jgi:pyrroloquinoline quinone (PQQ) biosynthesis protein C
MTESQCRHPEQTWIQWIRETENPSEGLRQFAAHYHYFSVHQITSLTKLVQLLSPTDAQSLAELGQVIFDELGEGDARHVHSVMFQRFARALGVDPALLPLQSADVLPSVRAYLEALDTAFSGPDLGRAIGAYVFLERSAVRLYQPLLEALAGAGVPHEALEFFRVHAEVELRHSGTAEALVLRLCPAQAPIRESFDAELEHLAALWNAIFRDLMLEHDKPAQEHHLH